MGVGSLEARFDTRSICMGCFECLRFDGGQTRSLNNYSCVDFHYHFSWQHVPSTTTEGWRMPRAIDFGFFFLRFRISTWSEDIHRNAHWKFLRVRNEIKCWNNKNCLRIAVVKKYASVVFLGLFFHSKTQFMSHQHHETSENIFDEWIYVWELVHRNENWWTTMLFIRKTISIIRCIPSDCSWPPQSPATTTVCSESCICRQHTISISPNVYPAWIAALISAICSAEVM